MNAFSENGIRRMRSPVCFLLTVTALLLSCSDNRSGQASSSEPTAPSEMWITAYYTVWGTCGLQPGDIDYGSLTHIIHQSLEPDAGYPGRYWKFPRAFHDDDTLYFEQGIGTGCNPSPVQSDLIRLAHKNGVRVLLGLGGAGAGAGQLTIITGDQKKLEQYVHSTTRYAKHRGYDGVDVDWEFVWRNDEEGFIRLLKMLRDTLDTWKPKGLLTIAIPGWFNREYGYNISAMNLYCDQINLMYYDLAGSWNKNTGYNAPLYRPSFEEYDGAAIDPLLTEYLGKGLPRNKLGFGVPFFGVSWSNNDRPGTARNGWPVQIGFADVLLRIDPSTYHWDEVSKVPWLGGTSNGAQFFISYDDSASLVSKVEYAKAMRLGGVMIFELWRGVVASNPVGSRHPLLSVVSHAARRR
jgi:chitinase